MSAQPLPEKIGRYQILELVGRGGMGVLYRGFDPVLDREVAVKVMLTDFSMDNEHMRTRFYREAKAAAKLQHRNIVTVFEFAEENNQPHIVMEFLRGTPLGSRLAQTPHLTLDDKLDIVAQLCSGLGYAHSQGVVHRDVKPANVFLLEDGSVKLLDFGIAKLTSSTLTQQGDVLGSAQYMSPEQVAGSDKVDGRADVWSTGVLLFEMLAGRKPFDGDALTNVIVKILKEDPPSIDTLVPNLPKPLVAAVSRALEKDPDKRTPKAEELGRELQSIRKTLQASGSVAPMEATRYASTQVLKALHDDLQKQTGGETAAARTEAATIREAPPAAPAPGSNSWIAGAAGVALIAAVGAGYWVTRPSQPPQQPPAVSTTTVPATDNRATAPAGASGGPGGAVPLPTAPVKQQPVTKLAEGPAADPTKVKPRVDKPADAAAPLASAPAPPPATPAAPARPAPMVEVSMSGPYAFEVFDGTKSISAAATTHQFSFASGRSVRVVAPEFFLDQSVRVDGGGDQKFEYSPPALGSLDIRAARTDCKVMIGKTEKGYLPLPQFRVAAGEYEVSLACPDGQNPKQTVTVPQGRTANVRFLK